MEKKHIEAIKPIALLLFKVLWLPVLLLLALAIGLYVGYGMTSDTPSEIFRADLWRNFFNQLFGN